MHRSVSVHLCVYLFVCMCARVRVSRTFECLPDPQLTLTRDPVDAMSISSLLHCLGCALDHYQLEPGQLSCDGTEIVF